MTKQIRIENADTSDHKVVVEVWDKSLPAAPDAPAAPDTLAQTIDLSHPTALASVAVHAQRYLVVKEVPK